MITITIINISITNTQLLIMGLLLIAKNILK